MSGRKLAARAGLVAALLSLGSGVALAGAPDSSLQGPLRGITLHLAYYPPTPRAAGMGGATVAVAGVDSLNPAAVGFAKAIDLSLDYGRHSFSRGPDLDFYHGQVVFPMPGLGGYMKLMGMSLSTRDEDDTSRLGLDFHFWARELGFAYGREVPLPDGVPGRLAIGAGGYPSDPSEVRASPPGGSRLASGRAHSELGSIRLGMLYEPVEQLSLGAQYTHILDYLYTDAPAFGVSHDDDRYHVNLFTVGAAFKPDDKTVIAIQHLFGRASGRNVYLHPDDKIRFDYFSLGAERQIPITEEIGLALRAGMLRGNFTCGLGVTLPKDFRVDYALMSHYGYDVRNEFGTGPLHIIGVAKSF